MKRAIVINLRTLSLLVIGLSLFSCGEDYRNEKIAGPYKIVKAEIAYYNNYSSAPDSITTYENDTLGYFNLYNATPSKAFIIVNYPSIIFATNYNAWYKMHEKNTEILVFETTTSSVKMSVDEPFKKNQQWTHFGDNYTGSQTRETIFVEKQ